jgi:RNA polymerase sigma factor (sigma-70 family)
MTQIQSSLMRMIPLGTPTRLANQAAAEFEDLAMPLANSAYNLARWLARNDQDAEDLVQETYLKALRSFASFQPGTNFRAWIYRILRNTFLTSRTRLEAASIVSLDSEEGSDLAVETETPETILRWRLSSELLQGAIDDLPIHYRETLLLCDVEEMSYREIAEVLSIPIGTVMSRLSRARKLVSESVKKTSVMAPSKNLAHQIDTHNQMTLRTERCVPFSSPEIPSCESGRQS